MSRLAERRVFVGVSVGVAAALVVLFRLLLPTSTAGLDSDAYYFIATHPFDADKSPLGEGPFAYRYLVPFVVWLLPVPPNLGFHVVTATALVLGGALVALVARSAGATPIAVLAAPAYVASFVGFYGLWQWRMIDTVTAALCTAAILAALHERRRLVAVLSLFATASKEVGLTLPLAYVAVRHGLPRPSRRLARDIAVVAAPAVVVFLLMHALLPHYGSYDTPHALRHWWKGFTTQGHWGYARPFVQIVLQNYGLLWLLWPLGIALGDRRWRRIHLYAALLVPVLAGGPWARSAIYLAPFVFGSAFLVLSRQRAALSILALAANAWVTVLLSLRNIAIEPPGLLASNASLLPGIVVFVLATAPAAAVALDEATSGRFRRPALARLA